MIRLDLKDARPIYEQIVDKYKRLILLGVLQRDEQMPSVRQLAVDLATNPNTVQKAYAQLERDRYIYSVPGRGNFVRPREDLLLRRKEELAGELLLWVEEVETLGFDPEQIWRETCFGQKNRGGKYD